MADKKKMSVADILAAARKLDSTVDASQESAAAPPADATSAEHASTEAASSEPAAESLEKPTPAKTGGKLASSGTSPSGGRPSVAEIMAMARGKKEAGAPDKPASSEAKKPAAAKPAATQAAAQATPKAASKAPAKTKPTPAAPRDTASILAAARSGHRAGPMSKAEAAKVKPEAKPTKKPVSIPPMPEKPAYAAAQTKRPEKAVGGSRRNFFLSVLLGSSLAVGFASMSVTFGLWLLGTARFMFPNVLRVPPSQFKVGFPSDFAPGQVETKFKAKFGIWIVNTEYNGEPEIFALKSVCTHLGCTPNWLEAEQKFKCPCHGSGYYKDGVNFEGPAPRPLERYAISIADDGQVLIDKSRTFQEEMGQWVDPASFLPA